MTYEHPSEDAARRRLESEFNDDEDYIVAGSLAPSLRNNLYNSRRQSPPTYNRYMSERAMQPQAKSRSSASRHISSSTYERPMDTSSRGGGDWWDRTGGMGRYNGGGENYYTERTSFSGVPRVRGPGTGRYEERPKGGGLGLVSYDERSKGSPAGYDDFVGEEARPWSNVYDNGYNRTDEPWRGSNGLVSAGRSYDTGGRSGVRGSRSYDDYAPAYGRQRSKLLYDGAAEEREKERRFYEQTRANPKPPEEKEFLGKVQRELEEQRREWKDEIDRLTNSTLMPSSNTTYNVAKNSTIDTSSGQAIFKAFVDVSEFPPSSVKVNVDKLTNKVVVEAKQSASSGGMAKSFTQRIQLPRYADDHNLVARMNKKGILKVEVPLVFYFPEQESRDDSSKAKSFVYEVRTDPINGSKVMEILVNTGRDMSSKDLKVEMDGDKLQIWAEKSPGGSVGSASPGGDRSLIKQYTMPPNADTDRIRIERTRDGRHAILIPLF